MTHIQDIRRTLIKKAFITYEIGIIMHIPLKMGIVLPLNDSLKA